MSIAVQTAQAAVLSATSNILAQAIQAYRADTPLALDPAPIVKFVLYALLNCPPNVLWQGFLEETWPGQKQPRLDTAKIPNGKEKDKEKEEKRPLPGGGLDVRNVLIKIVLDQTVGAWVNTVMFIAFMRGMDGYGAAEIVEAIRTESWPLMLAGAKVWPLFSAVAFLCIPAEKRVVSGAAVGVLWGIYLSLLEAGDAGRRRT